MHFAVTLGIRPILAALHSEQSEAQILVRNTGKLLVRTPITKLQYVLCHVKRVYFEQTDDLMKTVLVVRVV